MNATKFQVDSCLVYYVILQNKALLNDTCYRTAACFYTSTYDWFLEAFANLRKLPVNFFMPVPLPACLPVSPPACPSVRQSVRPSICPFFCSHRTNRLPMDGFSRYLCVF